MKKIITKIVLVIFTLTLIGCGNDIVKKSIEQAKTAIENKEYEEALASLELALDEENDNEEAKKLYSIVENYQKVQDLMKENNIDEAKKTLDGINTEYVNYAIKEDIDSLKLQVEEQIKGRDLVNNNLTKLLKLVDEKKYDEANALVEEIHKSTPTKEQKNNVDELKIRIDSELAEIESNKKAQEQARLVEEQNKKEEANKKVSNKLTQDEAIDKIFALAEIKEYQNNGQKISIIASEGNENGMNGYIMKVGINGEQRFETLRHYFVESTSGNIYKQNYSTGKYDLINN